MTNPWKIPIFICIIGFTFACDKTANDRQMTRIKRARQFTDIFQLEKRIRLQFPGSLRIENIIDAVLLPGSKICILTNGQTPSAFLFDASGRFLSRLKPDDKFIKNFGQPWQAELDPKNNLNILDLKRHKIFIFNPEGRYLASRTAPPAAASFRISSANHFYFNLPAATDGTTIFATYENGKASHSFSLMPVSVQQILRFKKIIPKRPLLTFDDEGNIFQAFPIENTIYQFGIDFHFKGSFNHVFKRYKAPNISAWNRAARNKHSKAPFRQVLSETTLFSGLHNPARNVLMAEFLNIADRHPRFLAFFTTAGEFLNGDIIYDRDRFGTILRADKERLFTCTKETKGSLANFTLNVYLIPRD